MIGYQNMPDHNFEKLKILIVDNNAFVAKTLFSVLEAFRVNNVFISGSLEDAEKKMREITFDVIFIDFMMENKIGIEFITKIRKEPSQKNDQAIPVILFTAFTDLQTITQARDSGITEVISKPFSPEHVFLKLKSVLSNEREFITVDDYLGPNRRRRQPNDEKWNEENDRRAR